MKTFLDLLDEEYYADSYSLSESKDNPNVVGGVSNNTKGVLHELLVGKFLNNDKHMDKHEDENKMSPQQVHDMLKSQIHPKDYEKIESKAKSAAEDIRKNIEHTYPNHKIENIVWTSKPGDTAKVTGIAASQKEDSSDIYITSKDKKTGKVLHHGYSLKVSDNPSKEIPASSLGIKSAGSKAQELFKEHQARIKNEFLDLAKVKKQPQHEDLADARKEWARENPEKHNQIKKYNRELLNKVATEHAKELQAKIKSGDHENVINHIRDIIAAKATPAEKAGVATFSKHTTYQTAKGTQHNTANPSIDYENILKNPKNISVHPSGSSVIFKYNGHTFATQSHKLDSQSDPLSNLKSAGKASVTKPKVNSMESDSNKSFAEPNSMSHVTIHNGGQDKKVKLG